MLQNVLSDTIVIWFTTVYQFIIANFWVLVTLPGIGDSKGVRPNPTTPSPYTTVYIY